MLDYRDSVENMLKNITQEQVDLWGKLHKENRKISLEEFIFNFKDYDRDGLTTLTALSSLAPIQNEMNLKSDDDKAFLFHKLMEYRLKKAGLSDGDIEKQIIKSVVTTFDVDTLLKEEIRKGVSQSALNLKLNAKDNDVFDTTSLREAIIAEHDAINLYEQLAANTSDEKLKKLLLDIAAEEKVHVGELEAKLNQVDSENEPSVEEGKTEASNLLNRPVKFGGEQDTGKRGEQ
jgi:hypothetical protein